MKEGGAVRGGAGVKYGYSSHGMRLSSLVRASSARTNFTQSTVRRTEFGTTYYSSYVLLRTLNQN